MRYKTERDALNVALENLDTVLDALYEQAKRERTSVYVDFIRKHAEQIHSYADTLLKNMEANKLNQHW